MTDRDLGELMTRTVATLEPRTAAIVAGATTRGRTLLRRRRAAQGISAMAVAGLITTITVAIWPAPSSEPVSRRPAGSTPLTGSPTAQPHPVLITPQVLAQRTIDLLPRAASITALQGNSAPGYIGAGFVYDDGHGAAKIAITLSYGPAGGLGAACQISTCTTRSDGSKLAVYRGSDRPGQPTAEPKLWELMLRRADGLTVALSEWNAPEQKGQAATTRRLPPLTVKQATRLIASTELRTRVPAAEVAAAAGLFTPDPPDDGAANSTAPGGH